MSVDNYIDYSLERLKHLKWHIVIFENTWSSIDVLNFQSRDALLNYFILWEHWMKYNVEDVKKILFNNSLKNATNSN